MRDACVVSVFTASVSGDDPHRSTRHTDLGVAVTLVDSPSSSAYKKTVNKKTHE